MIDGASAFAAWLSSTVAPWWVFTSLLLVLGGSYRVYRVLTAERREATRRHRLLEELKAFIGGAIRANVERARALHDEKLRRHAVLFVRSMPISALRQAGGIGPATVRALEAAGYRTLGDVQDRDIRGVRAIGRVKYDAAARWMHYEAEAAYHKLLAGSDEIPRDPYIEASYTAAIEQLGVRNQVLEDDREGLQPAADELARYEAEVAQRTNGTRLREWLRSPIDAVRSDPSRPLRFFVLALLFVGITASIPFVALGLWRDLISWNVPALAFAAGFLAMHFYFFTYVFASERAVKLGTRPLDPRSYQEQRLQFLGLTMALKRGIAPPEVRITSAAVTELRGHRAGPSLIGLPADDVRYLARETSQAAIEFMLAHEVGRLSGDHQRVATTVETLLAPFAWVAHGMVVLLATALSWGFEPRRGGLAILVFVCLLCPSVWFLPLGVAAVAVYLAVAVIRVVLSTDMVYDADRTGRELTSSEAMIEMLGSLSTKKRLDDARRFEHDGRLGLDLLVPEPELPLRTRVSRWVNRALDRITAATPSMRRRLKVVDSPSVPLVDTVLGTARVSAILVVAVAGLVAAGVQATFFAGLRPLASRPAALTASTSAEPPIPPVEPIGPATVTRTVLVHGNVDSCNIRHAPDLGSHVVGSVRTGASCQVLRHDERWLEADCGGIRGFIGSGCVENAPPLQ